MNYFQSVTLLFILELWNFVYKTADQRIAFIINFFQNIFLWHKIMNYKQITKEPCYA